MDATSGVATDCAQVQPKEKMGAGEMTDSTTKGGAGWCHRHYGVHAKYCARSRTTTSVLPYRATMSTVPTNILRRSVQQHPDTTHCVHTVCLAGSPTDLATVGRGINQLTAPWRTRTDLVGEYSALRPTVDTHIILYLWSRVLEVPGRTGMSYMSER